MKVCRICKEDCSSKARVRDPEGNYYCKSCFEEQKAAGGAPGRAPARAPAAVAAPGVGADDAGFSAMGDDAGPDVQPDGYGLADLMEDNGLAGAQMCPQCGDAMRVGATLCIRCGYDPHKGKSLKTAVTVEKEPKEPRAARSSGAGVSVVSGLFDESVVLPILTALALGGVLAAASGNEDLRLTYFAVAGLVGTGVWVWGLVLMLFDSVVHALFGFICGLYWLYWVIMNSDNRALKWMTLVSVLGSVLGRAMLGFPEREA